MRERLNQAPAFPVDRASLALLRTDQLQQFRSASVIQSFARSLPGLECLRLDSFPVLDDDDASRFDRFCDAKRFGLDT